MVRAHRRADLAYERGDYWIAETEDARADALAEQLEAEIAEITEDFEKTQEREAEQWAFWPDPANYLASQYAEWVSGRSPHFRTASELAEHLRAYLDDYSPHFRRTTTDAQILEAAQDAYEAALARRRRLEPVHGTARGGEATPIRAFRAPSDGA